MPVIAQVVPKASEYDLIIYANTQKALAVTLANGFA